MREFFELINEYPRTMFFMLFRMDIGYFNLQKTII